MWNFTELGAPTKVPPDPVLALYESRLTLLRNVDRDRGGARTG
jgi:hypothetical protein